MICVRENLGRASIAAPAGGSMWARRPSSRCRRACFTRTGIERIVRYAFKVAESRPRKMLASATKSNALQHAMVLWDEVAAEVAKDFPHVKMQKYHVDALCARMVTHPQTLDVIVASNLFGDILTDIGSAISGSLGVAPGGNINPDRTAPSMFEPITDRRPTSRARASPIRSLRSGPAR
jgi:tartrate dehydrogenase/decarboxylase/D-malate dehydrogenase